MKIEESYVHSISFTLSYDVISGYDEITVFKGLIKKLKSESKKSGFKKLLNRKEAELIMYMHDSLIKEEDEEPKDKGVSKSTGKEIQIIT